MSVEHIGKEYTEALGNGHHKRVVSIIVGD